MAIYLIVIILGLIIGSFLNVVILRFDDLKSIINTRSHCPQCKKKLGWLDLVPVLSYMFLFGKCRHCKANISLQYPLVEAGTALLFACLYFHFGFSLLSLSLALISCIMIIIFAYDILKLQISDFLVILIASIWLIYLAIDYFFIHHSLSTILNSFYGALALGGFFGILVAISKERWMGMGDIGLGVAVGLIVGWPNVLVAALLAFLSGSFIGLILMAVNKKKFKDKLPFAPFLIGGLWLTLFWGSQILNWYMNLLG